MRGYLLEPTKDELVKDGWKLFRADGVWKKEEGRNIKLKVRCSQCGNWLEDESNDLLLSYEIKCGVCKWTRELKFPRGGGLKDATK